MRQHGGSFSPEFLLTALSHVFYRGQSGLPAEDSFGKEMGTRILHLETEEPSIGPGEAPPATWVDLVPAVTAQLELPSGRW